MADTSGAGIGAIALLAVVAAFGCGDRPGSAESRVPEPRVDTIDGVRHVWNPSAGAWSEGEAWRVEELLRLGARQSPREELFSGPLLTAATGPDGAIYVLDSVGGGHLPGRHDPRTDHRALGCALRGEGRDPPSGGRIGWLTLKG